MSDSSLLQELIHSLHSLKGMKEADIIDNLEYQEFRRGILDAMKLAINRMKETPIEDEMVKSIRERLHEQFKEDDKLYGKKPVMYKKDKD